MTRRLLAVQRVPIQCAMTAARQWGVGTPGGAEAIIFAHHTIEEMYEAGLLDRPLAVIQVDQKNMFGNLEWDEIRKSMLAEVPALAASTAWKHRLSSEIEQPGMANSTKDRGAEQGDAAAPLEAGVTQGTIARKSRAEVHMLQKAGTLPWRPPVGVSVSDMVNEFDARHAAIAMWEAEAPKSRAAPAPDGSRRTHPGHAVQLGGGIVDAWYLDDGTI
eukprot:8212126-Karenia_brevis.AAC.1